MNVTKKIGSPKIFSVRQHKGLLFIALLLLSFLIIPELMAQSGLKISNLSEVKAQAVEGVDTVTDVSKKVVGGVLMVAFIFVCWAVASNQPHGKEFAIGWVVAVVITLIAFSVV